jgi:hypothetical protein
MIAEYVRGSGLRCEVEVYGAWVSGAFSVNAHAFRRHRRRVRARETRAAGRGRHLERVHSPDRPRLQPGRSQTIQTKHNQVTIHDFNPDQLRRLFRLHLWKRIANFVLRTLSTCRDLVYNTRLVLKHPRAMAHAAKNATGASWSAR